MRKFLTLLLLVSTLYATLPIPAGAVTYATWNSADKNANVTLTGGDLIATHTSANSWIGVRSTVSETSGKWYWEVTYTIRSTSNAGMNGAALSSASLSAAGDGADMYTFGDANGEGWSNLVNTFTLGPSGVPSQGDVYGYAWDVSAGTLKIYRNNSLQGTLTSVPSGSFAIAIMFTLADSMTANFGATALTYTPPAGYNAGLYSSPAAGASFNPWQFFVF